MINTAKKDECPTIDEIMNGLNSEAQNRWCQGPCGCMALC